MHELSMLDKVNIAHCALRRADEAIKRKVYHGVDATARFHGEYDTIAAWKNHRVTFGVTTDGRPLNYVTWP